MSMPSIFYIKSFPSNLMDTDTKVEVIHEKTMEMLQTVSDEQYVHWYASLNVMDQKQADIIRHLVCNIYPIPLFLQ